MGAVGILQAAEGLSGMFRARAALLILEKVGNRESSLNLKGWGE